MPKTIKSVYLYSIDVTRVSKDCNALHKKELQVRKSKTEYIVKNKADLLELKPCLKSIIVNGKIPAIMLDKVIANTNTDPDAQDDYAYIIATKEDDTKVLEMITDYYTKISQIIHNEIMEQKQKHWSVCGIVKGLSVQMQQKPEKLYLFRYDGESRTVTTKTYITSKQEIHDGIGTITYTIEGIVNENDEIDTSCNTLPAIYLDTREVCKTDLGRVKYSTYESNGNKYPVCYVLISKYDMNVALEAMKNALNWQVNDSDKRIMAIKETRKMYASNVKMLNQLIAKNTAKAGKTNV